MNLVNATFVRVASGEMLATSCHIILRAIVTSAIRSVGVEYKFHLVWALISAICPTSHSFRTARVYIPRAAPCIHARSRRWIASRVITIGASVVCTILPQLLDWLRMLDIGLL